MDDKKDEVKKEEKEFINTDKVNEAEIDPGNEHSHLESSENEKEPSKEKKDGN